MRRCHNFSDDSPLAHLPEDAPECILAERIHEAAMDRELDALDKLLETSPTSVAGMAALLDRLSVDPYEEVEEDNPPDTLTEPLIIVALERSPDLMATLASALQAIGAVS